MSDQFRIRHGKVVGARAPSASFAGFYRASVRRIANYRVSASDLYSAYNSWAARAGGERLWYRDLKREMVSRGHGHVKSDGAFFCDAVVVEPADFELGNGDAAGRLIVSRERVPDDVLAALMDRFDALATSVDDLKREVIASFAPTLS